MIRIAICDDEKIFIDSYIKLINNIKKEYKYDIEIYTFESGEDLIKYTVINEIIFDLVFLDIIMEGLSGVETAKKLKQMHQAIQIVFLTSSKEYALDGYEIRVFNYIIKNSDQSEFKIYEAIKHCYSKSNEYIIIKNRSSIEKIEISKIVYIESDKRKIIVNTVDSKYEIYEKLDNMYEKLEKFDFVKTHRSYIVNIHYIKKIDTKVIITTKGDTILLSRANIDNVRDKFISYLENSDIK